MSRTSSQFQPPYLKKIYSSQHSLYANTPTRACIHEKKIKCVYSGPAYSPDSFCTRFSIESLAGSVITVNIKIRKAVKEAEASIMLMTSTDERRTDHMGDLYLESQEAPETLPYIGPLWGVSSLQSIHKEVASTNGNGMSQDQF